MDPSYSTQIRDPHTDREQSLATLLNEVRRDNIFKKIKKIFVMSPA